MRISFVELKTNSFAIGQDVVVVAKTENKLECLVDVLRQGCAKHTASQTNKCKDSLHSHYCVVYSSF